MIFICEFIGGERNGCRSPLEQAEQMTDKRSRNWSKERSRGDLVPRKELDDRPKFSGDLGPMWDGLRYEINGKTYYDFEVRGKPELAEEAKHIEPTAILRYETQEVYDLLSN